MSPKSACCCSPVFSRLFFRFCVGITDFRWKLHGWEWLFCLKTSAGDNTFTSQPWITVVSFNFFLNFAEGDQFCCKMNEISTFSLLSPLISYDFSTFFCFCHLPDFSVSGTLGAPTLEPQRPIFLLFKPFPQPFPCTYFGHPFLPPFPHLDKHGKREGTGRFLEELPEVKKFRRKTGKRFPGQVTKFQIGNWDQNYNVKVFRPYSLQTHTDISARLSRSPRNVLSSAGV